MTAEMNSQSPTAIDLAKIRWYVTHLENRAIELYALGDGASVDAVFERAAADVGILPRPELRVPTDPCPPGWFLCPSGCSPRPCLGEKDMSMNDSTTDSVQ